MAKSNKALVTFTAGEWSPSKGARIDLEKAAASMRICRNMIVDRYGGVFRRPGLKYVSTIKDFAAISYVSYSGSGTLYGITEFGDLSSPPRKYRNLTSNGIGFARKETGSGSGSSLEAMQVWSAGRNGYNDAGSLADTFSYGRVGSNKGQDWTLYGSPPVGTPKQIGAPATATTGGAVIETMEDYVPGSGNGWLGSWFDSADWVRAKRTKSYALADLIRPSLEDGNSPFFLWVSDAIGSTTSSNNRANLFIAAEKGTDVWTVYVRFTMGAPATGNGPLAQLYVTLADGDNAIPEGVSDMKLVQGYASFGTAFNGYAKFVVLPDTSMRFRLEIAGEPEGNFPTDWITTNSYPITDEDIQAAGGRNWLYLPDVSTGVWPEDTYKELLSLEDAPEDFLLQSGASGVVVGTEEWAETSAFTGGITAESHDPIDYTMRIVRSSVPQSEMTIGYTYPFTLTYSERDIGGANPNTLMEVVDYVATAAAEDVSFDVKAEPGRQRKLINVARGTGVAPAVVTTLESETVAWKARATDNGGTYTAAQVSALDTLHAAMKAINGSLNQMTYFMPFCGNDLAAALVPSIDINGYGNPTNHNSNFVEADYDDERGMIGTTKVSDATAKILLLPFHFGQIDPGYHRIEMGYAITEKPVTGLNNNVMGMWADPTNYAFCFTWNEGLSRYAFYFGETANGPTAAPESENAGDVIVGARRSATERRIYKNGVSIALNSTSDSASNIADYNPAMMGREQTVFGGTSLYGPCPTGYVLGCQWIGFHFATTDAKQLALSTAIKAYLTELGRI